MSYNKAQAQAVGAALYDLFKAVSDGVDVSDAGTAMTVLTAVMAASDEFQGDMDAAVFDAVSGLASAIADDKLDPPVT